MKKLILILIVLISSEYVFSQNNVGIGITTPDASAILDLTATDLGLLIPRVALTQTSSNLPITAPATSLLVYNTATVNDVIPGYYYWNGSTWILFGSGTSTDDQNISGSGLLGTTLTIGIENGTNETVDLSSLQDGTGTDDQNISGSGLSGNILTIGIENGTNETVDLSVFANNNDAWLIDGNSGTNPATNFLGTTDAQDLAFRTNNVEKMRIESGGNIGIGTTAPATLLHVNGSFRLTNGTQANGKILTSDANGTGTWQESPVQPVVYSETTTPYGSDNTRKTITITTTSATDKVLLLGEFDFSKDGTASYVSLGIWRGGTEIAETSIYGTASADNTCFVQWVDVPGIGTFTYTLQDRAGAGSYGTIYGSMLTAVVYK